MAGGFSGGSGGRSSGGFGGGGFGGGGFGGGGFRMSGGNGFMIAWLIMRLVDLGIYIARVSAERRARRLQGGPGGYDDRNNYNSQGRYDGYGPQDRYQGYDPRGGDPGRDDRYRDDEWY